MIREVIESLGFTQVTNSKYVKSGVTLWLGTPDFEMLIMTLDHIRIIEAKDILGARKSIKNFLEHTGEL